MCLWPLIIPSLWALHKTQRTLKKSKILLVKQRDGVVDPGLEASSGQEIYPVLLGQDLQLARPLLILSGLFPILPLELGLRPEDDLLHVVALCGEELFQGPLHGRRAGSGEPSSDQNHLTEGAVLQTFLTVTSGTIGSLRSGGGNLITEFQSRVTTLLWNNALWLGKTHDL